MPHTTSKFFDSATLLAAIRTISLIATADKDGNAKTLPLFGDIDLRTSRYTFSYPTGLLYATQFAQIALVVTEKVSTSRT